LNIGWADVIIACVVIRDLGVIQGILQ